MNKFFQRLEKKAAKVPMLGILALLGFQSLEARAELNPSWISVTNQLGVSGRSGTALKWFQADTFRYDINVLSGTNTADLADASFGMWYVIDRLAGTAYIAKTGSISGSRVRFQLSQAESNLPEGTYESIARIYRVTGSNTNEIGTIGRNPVEVMWSPDSTNFALASGITGVTFNITVQNITGSTGSVNEVKAGTLMKQQSNTTGIVTVSVDTVAADARWVEEGQSNSITSGMITDGQVNTNDMTSAADQAYRTDWQTLVVKGTGAVSISCTTNGTVITCTVDGPGELGATASTTNKIVDSSGRIFTFTNSPTTLGAYSIEFHTNDLTAAFVPASAASGAITNNQIYPTVQGLNAGGGAITNASGYWFFSVNQGTNIAGFLEMLSNRLFRATTYP